MSITPTQLPLVPKMKKDLMLSLLAEGRRIDNRKLDEPRKIEIVTNYAERANGSALVKLGETLVLAGIKLELGAPFPDTPDEGVLIVNAEFVPIASPFFEPGPPDENAAELARVIDRSLRAGKTLDLKALALIPGSRVLVVWCDLYIMSHAGNLIDAASLAAMSALATTRLPKLEMSGNSVKLIRGSRDKCLEIKNWVVTSTVAKIGDYFVADPNDEEEAVADVRFTIAFNKSGEVVGAQKAGFGALTLREIDEALDLAWKTAVKYFAQLESSLDTQKCTSGDAVAG
ncbi:MAG: exosome complex protein Rrp42 [Fervidicoccaceae archaeon]